MTGLRSLGNRILLKPSSAIVAKSDAWSPSRWPRRPWNLSSLASNANRVFPQFAAVNEAGSSREQVSLLNRGLRVSEGTAATTPPGDVMHIT